jgi:hypothetical protein
MLTATDGGGKGEEGHGCGSEAAAAAAVASLNKQASPSSLKHAAPAPPAVPSVGCLLALRPKRPSLSSSCGCLILAGRTAESLSRRSGPSEVDTLKKNRNKMDKKKKCDKRQRRNEPTKEGRLQKIRS